MSGLTYLTLDELETLAFEFRSQGVSILAANDEWASAREDRWLRGVVLGAQGFGGAMRTMFLIVLPVIFALECVLTGFNIERREYQDAAFTALAATLLLVGIVMQAMA